MPTDVFSHNNIRILKTKVDNITKVGFLEKGISTLTIQGSYKKAIKKYFFDIKFDMVVYSTRVLACK